MRHAQQLAPYHQFPLIPSERNRNLQAVCNSTDSVTTAANQTCMEEVPGAQSYNCEANDVRVANVTIKRLFDVNTGEYIPRVNGTYSCTEGDILLVDFEAEMLNGANSARFDVGVWWRFGGDTALTSNESDCAVTS